MKVGWQRHIWRGKCHGTSVLDTCWRALRRRRPELAYADSQTHSGSGPGAHRIARGRSSSLSSSSSAPVHAHHLPFPTPQPRSCRGEKTCWADAHWARPSCVASSAVPDVRRNTATFDGDAVNGPPEYTRELLNVLELPVVGLGLPSPASSLPEHTQASQTRATRGTFRRLGRAGAVTDKNNTQPVCRCPIPASAPKDQLVRQRICFPRPLRKSAGLGRSGF